MKKSNLFIYIFCAITYSILFVIFYFVEKTAGEKLSQIANIFINRVLDFPFGMPLWNSENRWHIYMTFLPNSLLLGELIILLKNLVLKRKK